MTFRIALLLAVAALAGCGGDDDDDESASPPASPASSRCEEATSALMDPLNNALQSDRDELVNGQVVKSNDHEDIYFVSAELHGPGLFDPGDIGTWATTDTAGSGAIYSVDEFAKDHTTVGDGTAIAGLSMDDDGATESRECVTG